MSNAYRTRHSVLLGALILVASIFVAPASAAETRLRGQFLGEAWGNRGNVKSGEISTRLGRSAYQPCPCKGTQGEIRSNTVHNVDAGDVYRAGTLVSTAQAEKTPDMRAFGQTTSRVKNVSALDGFITVDSLIAVATVRATASTITASAAGSAIAGLEINGQAITVDPGEQVNVPGFGYALFHDVRMFGDGDTRRGVQVEMMRIVITRENDLDIPVGSVLIVAHARVGFTRLETASVVGAAAWGSQATSTSAAVVNEFGRSAPAYLGCFARGTSSGSNRVESTDLPGLFRTGLILSRVNGAVSADAAAARAMSRLENVNLLDGVLTADVIKGVASARVDGSGGSTSFDGSKFVDLRILGQAFSDDVAPNTQVLIPQLGIITLYATNARRDGDEAHASLFMVTLNVTVPNTQGIPVGSTIRLGRARADAHQP